MKAQMLRRDVFKFAGGSVAGLIFTPVPWRLLTDTALWSQNWSWVPKPPRGEIRTRFSHCALCPAGCAIKARCVGEQPVSLAGFGDDGALCPFGLTAHHLPFHPARLRQALRSGDPIPVERAAQAIQDAIAKRRAGESVAMLDLRPERTASWLYRRALAAVPDGVYIGASAPDTVAIDLAQVKTILSFGVPVLDGWGTPGRVLGMRDRFRLIQVEPVESRTALLADEWFPARPGSEDDLAQVLLGQLSAEEGARRTGIARERIEALAKALPESGPVLVLGDGAGVAALNERLHAPLLARREAPVPKEWQPAVAVTALADVPDHSIRVLLIDESLPGVALPWSSIEPKLAAGNPLVATIACSLQGYAAHATIVLPAPVPSEMPQDLNGAAGSPAASFRIATPLAVAPAGLADPVAVVTAVCGAVPVEKALEQRAAAIHQSGRGKLFNYAANSSTPVKDVKPEDFWKTLNEGGRWEDDAQPLTASARPAAVPTAAADSAHNAALAGLPLTVVLAAGNRGPATPLMTKLYQESNLRQPANQARLHPDTARECGVAEGERALLETRCGKCEVRVACDNGVMPGVVYMVAGPLVLDVCSGPGACAKVVRL
jgi:menaquinone reductase, molybdopterin-binding-like subunit